jgi:protein ImuB
MPDGIFIDVAGSSHLFKGETALLKDLLERLAKSGICAKASIADTPGCAWAVVRYGKGEIVPAGRASDALGSLPVAALRLHGAVIESLRDVGIERIASSQPSPVAPCRHASGPKSCFGSIRRWARSQKS